MQHGILVLSHGADLKSILILIYYPYLFCATIGLADLTVRRIPFWSRVYILFVVSVSSLVVLGIHPVPRTLTLRGKGSTFNFSVFITSCLQ